MELTAKKGDTVKAGDTLAVLEASDLDYEVAKLESAVAGAQAQRAQARELEQQQRDSLTGSARALPGRSNRWKHS
jgi:multidrug resistance efflux pump